MTNKDLLEWFSAGQRPVNIPVTISPGVKIVDYDEFVSTHLQTLEILGENTDHPVALRLRWLKEAIERGA